MKIIIEFIDHTAQRYPTVGDYQIDGNGDMQIRISNFGSEFENTMVAIHELIEFALLRHKGVTDTDIDNFDFDFRARLDRGEVGRNDEPGFAADCPYGSEHAFATSVELGMCAVAKINWNTYTEKIEGLFHGK